jgi:hypothetical protein
MTTSSDAQSVAPSGKEDFRAPLPEPNTVAFWIGLVVTAMALVSGLSTYLILTGLTRSCRETLWCSGCC